MNMSGFGFDSSNLIKNTAVKGWSRVAEVVTAAAVCSVRIAALQDECMEEPQWHKPSQAIS